MASADRSEAFVSGIATSAGQATAVLGNFEALRSEARAKALPSFVVIGPPRTGTTWLHDILNGRALLPCPTKETRFFDLHFHRGLSWYLDHFPPNSEGQVVGEVAPTYFASPEACVRISGVLPEAKLVMIFRNPVQRLVSLYRLKRAYGLCSWSLDEALERDPELLASSQYATHLKMWQNCFPAEQLSIHFFEELTADPQRFIDSICGFVGIPRFVLKDSERKHVFSTTKMTQPRIFAATKAALAVADWCKARKLDKVVHHVKNSRAFNLLIGGGEPFSSIPRESLAKVHAMLLPETEAFEAMVGRDLSQWKVPPGA